MVYCVLFNFFFIHSFSQTFSLILRNDFFSSTDDGAVFHTLCALFTTNKYEFKRMRKRNKEFIQQKMCIAYIKWLFMIVAIIMRFYCFLIARFICCVFSSCLLYWNDTIKGNAKKKVRSKNGVWPLWTANRLNKSIEIILIIALLKWNDPPNMKYGGRKLDLSKHYAMNEHTFDVPLFLSASCLPSPFLFSITPLNSHWFAF